MKGKIAIVTAANTSHFPLVMGLFCSIRDNVKRKIDLCCLDVGLDDDQKKRLEILDVKIIEPQWDYVGDFPAPWFRAMTARPHLEKYFPDYDLYIWLDADCWVQNEEGIETFISAAYSNDIAIAAAIYHEYRQIISVNPINSGPPTQLFYNYLWHSLFPKDTAIEMLKFSYLNAGVFSMRAGSPVWNVWQTVLGPTYERARLSRSFWTGKEQRSSGGVFKKLENQAFYHSEEIALNYSARQYSVAVLDATHNWMCSQCLPAIDKNGKFVTPGFQSSEIKILHLTAQTKEKNFNIKVHDGGYKIMSLRYKNDPV